MKINGMDYLNSFHGCQVKDYRLVKRFKGQLEGKNRYFYGAVITEIIGSILSIVLLFDILVGVMVSKPFPHASAIAFLICVCMMLVAKVYYERNSFVIAEYTLQIDEWFSEEERNKILQDFYLKSDARRVKSKNTGVLLVAYPKSKGGLE